MGTRNLVAVVLGGEYKVAQYGQWDGYPSGQGDTILRFLSGCDLDLFIKKVSESSFITEEEVASINKKISDEKINNWQKIYPELSRDTAANILSMIYTSENGVKLNNNIDFAGDSLMCEYGYVIDLDKKILEVFIGFNKSPLLETDRFFGFKQERFDYYPIRLAATYQIDNLPSLEQMVSDVDGSDENEE